MRVKTSVVGFFDAMGEEAVDFIINQTELTTVFCSREYVDKLIKMKKEGKCATVTNIVCYDGELTSE
jgi:long-subunit acyl-CoA synthetase (AMP-forming)